MSETALHDVAEVLASCKTGAAEAAAAIGRAFQREVQIAPGEHDQWQSSPTAAELDAPGLLVLLKTERQALVLTLPSARGLVPAWCAKPDAGGEGRLTTMAQELGMNLLPDTWLAHEFRACWVVNMATALRRGGVPADAVVLTLLASRAGHATESLALIWPMATPEGLFDAGHSDLQAGHLIGRAAPRGQATHSLTSRDLPPYTRSLLRIRVPVVVTLAEKRQKLSRIIELGPGSIIQFDKSCEEMLELEVGNRPVATGEAVKVGDKFGLRITAIALPDERFNPVHAERTGGAA
jgi:flagellar motor switch protein FliN/FliY